MYSNGTKEPNLTRNTTLSSADLIRIVSNGLSRNITASDFATAIQALTSTSGTKKIRSVNVSQSLLSTDDVLAMDSTGGVRNVYLPDVTDSAIWNSTTGYGKVFTIKKDTESANNVIVTPSNSQLIDGSTNYILNGATRPSVTIMSNGTEWKVIG